MCTAYYIISFPAILVMFSTSLSAGLRVKTASLRMYCNLTASQPDIICFDILCGAEGGRQQFIHNLKSRATHLDAHRINAVCLECLQSCGPHGGSVDAVQISCDDGGGIIRRFLPWSRTGHLISMMVTVSIGNLTATSPFMCFSAHNLSCLGPPVDLRSKVTSAGELSLSWTDQQSLSHPLTCSVRYTSNASLAWVHADEVTMRSIPLTNLSVGVVYADQVRCQTQGAHAPWSPLSGTVRVCLPEVTYLPETVLASTGSNLTVYCVLHNRSFGARKAAWWLDSGERVPEDQCSAVSERVSGVTLLDVRPATQHRFRRLYCCMQVAGTVACSCSHAALYVTDASIAMLCVTNGDITAMTCSWNSSQWVKFQYQTRDLPCVLTEEAAGFSALKECPVGGLGSSSCTLQPLFPVACYKIWLEFGKETDPITSTPVHITPMDHVKPFPPHDLVVTTIPEGLMNITWKRCELPVYDLWFEVRYAVDKADAQVHHLTLNQSVVVPVLEPCSTYVVWVRCRRHIGPGLWSDWSQSCRSQVHNNKAPEQGPDFWRELLEDSARNQTNVTLLFMPLAKEQPSCCVEGFTVELQTHAGQSLSQTLGLIPTYTFVWVADVQSVTITALTWNDMGLSSSNTDMTFRRHSTRAKSVSQFSVARVNSSCMCLTWSLLPAAPTPLSFVIEWQGQRVGAGVRWIRVPAHSCLFYLHDSFTIDDYSFALYPILMDGEGEPAYTQEDRGRSKGQQKIYVLLLVIVFMIVVLFLTLAISQRRMMKVIWWDVPDPNNCSWAQGVDLNKADAFEHLFRHHERLVSYPILLELETVSKAVIVENTWLLTQVRHRDMDRTLGGTEVGEQALASPDNLVQQDILAPDVPVVSTSVVHVNWCAGPYSTVQIPEKSTSPSEPPGLLSSSSGDGNFSASSDLSRSSNWACFDSPHELSDVSLDQEDKAVRVLAAGRPLSCFMMTAETQDQGEIYLRQAGEESYKVLCLELPAVINNQDSNRGDPLVNIVPKYIPHVQGVSSD